MCTEEKKASFLRRKIKANNKNNNISNLLIVSFLSVLVFGLTTQVSLVNNPHLTAFGQPYDHVHGYDHETLADYYQDHPHNNSISSEDVNIVVNSVNKVIELSTKTFNAFQQHHSHGHGPNSLPLNIEEEEENYDASVIARIGGEEAKKLLSELQNGKAINFMVSMDENGIDPIVYLYKS